VKINIFSENQADTAIDTSGAGGSAAMLPLSVAAICLKLSLPPTRIDLI